MGKQKFCTPIFLGVFIFLFIFAIRAEASNFYPTKTTNRNNEYFQRQLDKLCAWRIKIHERFHRFPVPRICKTKDIKPPTLEFYAEPTSITEGESAKLSWASDNAVSCEASNGWLGEKTLSGEETVSPLVTTTYTLSCDGVKEGIEKSVVVEVVPLPPVDVCPNLPDNQTTIPDGYHDENGECIADSLPPADVCPNIEGIQETIPSGFHKEGDNCVTDTPPAPTLDHVVISEVYYLGSSADEWVEIYNGTGGVVTMDGWTISDAVSSDVIPTTTIPNGGVVVIVGSTSSLSVPVEAQKIILSGSTIGSGLNNTGGEAVFLKNQSNMVVDSLSYGDNATGFISGLGVPLVSTGYSVGRLNLTADSDTATDWGGLVTPTPGGF